MQDHTSAACKNSAWVATVTLALLIGLAVVLLNHGITIPGQGQWKQGPAIVLPNTAAQVDPLQLVIDTKKSQLAYRLQCASAGKYGETKIGAVQSPEAKERVVTAISAGMCSSAGQMISTGTLLSLSNFKTADNIEVSLDVQPAITSTSGLRKVQHVYAMGTDGKLHSGGVWWEPAHWP